MRDKRTRGRPPGTQRIKNRDVELIALIQFCCSQRPDQNPDEVFRAVVQLLGNIEGVFPPRTRGAHLKRLRAHWRTLERLKQQRLDRDRLVKALLREK